MEDVADLPAAIQNRSATIKRTRDAALWASFFLLGELLVTLRRYTHRMLSLLQTGLEEGFEVCGGTDRDGLSLHFYNVFIPQTGQSAREGGSDGAEFGCEHLLCRAEFDLKSLRARGIGASFEKPIGETGFDVTEGEVFDLSYEIAIVFGHGGQHAEGEIGAAPEEINELLLLDEEELGGLHCPGIDGVTPVAGESTFAEGVPVPKDVDDLLFADPVHAVYRNAPLLNDEEAPAFFSFPKQVTVPLERFEIGETCDVSEIILGKAGEELAAL